MVSTRVHLATPLTRSIAEWVESDREQLTRKLRISVVDSCNLSCFFCHNEGQGPLGRSRGTMSPKEIRTAARAALASGVSEIKLTGGEPLLYKHEDGDILELVDQLSSIDSDLAYGVSMTTNGILLAEQASSLAEAGLRRVTVSAHSLTPSTFARTISDRDPRRKISAIKAGIRAAVASELAPVKVNTVLFGSSAANNYAEVGAIAAACREARVDQLRLYTVLNNELLDDATFESNYRFWDRDLATAVARQLVPNAPNTFVDPVLDFVSEWTSSLYPKPTLVLDCDGLSVTVEAMEDGRFEAIGLPAEGPYALRLSYDGKLRGIISSTNYIDVLALIRGGSSFDTLVEAFKGAREALVPRHL